MEITNGFAEYIGRQLNEEKEMTNKFAVGDKVVRVEPYIWIDDGGFMQVGREYLVVDASENVLILKGDFNNVQYDPTMFKLVKPKFANMKFKVNSPEHSKEIQEALFEIGYKWCVYGSQGATIMNTETPTLYTYDDGSIMYDSSDYESEYRMFNSSENQEYTVETTKFYKLIPVVTKVTVESPKPETIEIDGKTYDKEAVLKRLAELETVE